MGSHRRPAVQPAPLTVVRDPAPEIDVAQPGWQGDRTQPDAQVEPFEEPEAYGLRVNWQSEAVRIEAAEFLVATRVQHSARIRAVHDLEVLREPDDDD
jgi:hypothetical protein